MSTSTYYVATAASLEVGKGRIIIINSKIQLRPSSQAHVTACATRAGCPRLLAREDEFVSFGFRYVC